MSNIDKIKCTCCGKEKKPIDYYSTNSPLSSFTGKIHVCKNCFIDFSMNDENVHDIEKVKDSLRMIDKPFKLDLWKSSVLESSDGNRDILRTYMKNLGLHQNRELNWSDSQFVTIDSDGVMTDESGMSINDSEYEELVLFFGKGFSKEDYIWLIGEYNDFLNRYEADSKGMELLIKEICLTQLDIKHRRSKGEKVDAQQKTLQDLLGSSNLKPVQETGANAVEQESFGTLIKKYENDRPIPEPSDEWKDVDGISKYIKVFFTGHLARMLGKKDEEIETEYFEEINKFTVNEPINDDGDDDDSY